MSHTTMPPTVPIEGDLDAASASPTEPDASAFVPPANAEPSEPDARSSLSNAMVRSHLKGMIEALVFVSDTPMSASDIAKVAKAERRDVVVLLQELLAEYGDRGIRLVEVAGGYAFRTAPAFGPFVRDLTAQRPVKMTRAQLETLAIVAYRQPLTRPEVDDIRGVDSGPVLKMLLERGLVRILGKRDEPGRPLIYGTTSGFLSFFNLKSLKDLPSLKEFSELSDDSKREFERTLGEEVPVQMGGDDPVGDGNSHSPNSG